MDESERYRRDAAEMQKFMDSMRLEEDGSSDEHVLAKRRRLEEAALLMPTAVKSEMGTMTDESEFDHAKLLERLDRSLDRSAFLSMERDKAEKERMAAEEKAKAAQREMERVKKWAEVQVENNKKDFESVCKREAKLSQLVKEKDVEIQMIKMDRDARLTVEVRGLFVLVLFCDFTHYYFFPQQSRANEKQMNDSLARQGRLKVQLKEKTQALDELRKNTLDWKEVCICVDGCFRSNICCAGAPDVRAAVERARGRAGDEAAACGVVQVGGDDAFGADDGSDE